MRCSHGIILVRPNAVGELSGKPAVDMTQVFQKAAGSEKPGDLTVVSSPISDPRSA